jgi:hypothetical protein
MTRRARLSVEALDDRLTPSFTPWGQYSLAEFDQMTGHDVRHSSGLYLQAADFNADGWNDLIRVDVSGGPYGEDPPLGQIYLSREDGSLGDPQTFDPGPAPVWIAVGDFDLLGLPTDARPDLAIYNSYYDGSTGMDVDAVYVYGNNGPAISVTEYSYITEGNTGTTPVTFGVYLEYATETDVSVHYETADGTAVAGSDYVALSGDVTIPAGQTGATITVPVIGDRLPEPTEAFSVNVTDGQGTVFGYGVILDDEVAPQIKVTDARVTEGNTGSASATFTVTLSAGSDVPVTATYATADGTATAGSDYQAASGTLTFAPGETSETVTVPVNGDRLAEPNETFFIGLSGPTNATIADGQGVGTILDDEPRISISDFTKAEGKKNQTTQFTFTVTLAAAYDQPVTVSFKTSDGTATTGDSDYVGKTGTITFAPGETTKTITIVVTGDSKKEAAEYFYLDLYDNSTNSLFAKSLGTGTILNDD